MPTVLHSQFHLSLHGVFQIFMPLLGTGSELSAISYLLGFFFSPWCVVRFLCRSVSVVYSPSQLCLDNNYQWWTQLSLTVSKLSLTFFLWWLLTHFHPWALQNFLCSAAVCQLWILISTSVARWFAAEHKCQVSEETPLRFLGSSPTPSLLLHHHCIYVSDCFGFAGRNPQDLFYSLHSTRGDWMICHSKEAGWRPLYFNNSPFF